jgi:hypothetical protein
MAAVAAGEGDDVALLERARAGCTVTAAPVWFAPFTV